MDNKQVQKLINDIGAKSSPPYICINPKVKMDCFRQRYVSVKDFKTKEIKIVCSSIILRNKTNPFCKKRPGGNNIPDFKLQKMINQLGKTSNPPYECLLVNAGNHVRSGGQKHRLVKVRCLTTKKIKIVELSNLKRGVNPY